MTVFFTEEEMEWIKKEDFNWTIKKDCPDEIKAKVAKKLKLLYGRDKK